MIKRISTYLLLSVLILSSVYAFQKRHLHANATEESQVPKYTAGENIIIKIPIENWDKQDQLLCHASYGSTIIQGKTKESDVHFKLPAFFSQKIGLIDWTLGDRSGQLYIQAQDSVQVIETYIGPPSIIAGLSDYTMLVSIPTDQLDNPLPNGTEVKVNHQFQRNLESDISYVKDRVAYQNLNSYPRTNRMLISSESKGVMSKEMTINIVPEVPKGFKIYADRNHNYADGNQITRLHTSTIKDNYGNLVADGTFIKFIIRDKNNNVLQCFGSTVNGIAQSNMLHPKSYDEWTIKAYIEGIAESSSLRLIYQNIMEDFDYELMSNNRKVSIGPLKSFMNQLVPDGLAVTLNLYKDDKLIQFFYEESIDGKVSFHLLKENIPSGNYSCTLKTAGIEKRIEELTL